MLINVAIMFVISLATQFQHYISEKELSKVNITWEVESSQIQDFPPS